MKYVRWFAVISLILAMGYLSAFGLFADSTRTGFIGLVVVFLAGCAGVGALLPSRWQLSILCSWGAILMTVLELANTVGQDTVPGQQPTIQVVFIGWVAIGLALLGGYLGSYLRRQYK